MVVILSQPQCVKGSIRYNTEYSRVNFLHKYTQLDIKMVTSEGDIWSVLGGQSLSYVLFKGLIMDGCVLLTSTPECVVSPCRVIPRAQPEGSPRGETTHEGVDVNNTHPSMINPDYNMILANLTLNYQYFAY